MTQNFSPQRAAKSVRAAKMPVPTKNIITMTSTVDVGAILAG